MTAADAIATHRPWQDEWEFHEFLVWAERHLAAESTVLEIGTHRGGSTRCFRDVLRPKKLVSVDAHPLVSPEGWDQVTGRSQDDDVFRQARDMVGGRVDLLFIDGGHSYPEVIEDYNRYHALVRPGGIVALHDIGSHPGDSPVGCHVQIVWNELERSERCVTWRSPGGPGLGAMILP